MTSLACWLGVDSRAPASIYLASDSRITSLDGIVVSRCKKVFASELAPDCFAFCGDVAVAAALLDRVSRAAGALATAADRHCRLVDEVTRAVQTAPTREFAILHAARDGEGLGAEFRLWRTTFEPSTGVRDLPETLPTDSVLALALGSGAATVRRQNVEWRSSDVGRTSRAVFSAFCDAVASGTDPYSGPPPQLVALYRRDRAEKIGVVYGGRRYLDGREVSPEEAAAEVAEWRNELFERCDPFTATRLRHAQRHARPAKSGPTAVSSFGLLGQPK